MSSLHGLPPLPKSLSGFNLLDGHTKPPTPIRSSSIRGQPGHLVYPPHPKINGVTEGVTPPTGRKSTNLDTQLAILRREMVSFFYCRNGMSQGRFVNIIGIHFFFVIHQG